METILDALEFGSDRYKCDRTYETIKSVKNSRVLRKKALTRFENFVNVHEGWQELCHGHVKKCVSELMDEDMVLFKEKLNLKPPGGAGFCPHLDTPSLRVAFGKDGPQTFVTVMIAIDDMTSRNGCLRVCKGPWSSRNHTPTIAGEADGNPDGEGRQGAISICFAENQIYEELPCIGGKMIVFNGWCPHRSSINTTHFPRRAVFLTYNPSREGYFHDKYYEKMESIRKDWQERIEVMQEADSNNDLAALATIPRI